MKKVVVSILRYNPDTEKSHNQDFTIEIDNGLTVLDCLNKIKWEQDGTLTYRMSCRSAICGSCAIRINGKAKLACKTQADDVITKEGTLHIAPLGNTDIIKDLVVDLEPFWEKLYKITPWLESKKATNPLLETLQSDEDFKKIEDASTCILCGSCYSECNSLKVDKNFVGPHALAKAQRFLNDSRDIKTHERARKYSEPLMAWDCTHCGECSERCPTDAKPLERIEEIRQTVVNAGVQNNGGARHLLSFFKSVGSSGTLDERKIPIESLPQLSIGSLLEVLPVGLKMLSHGKQPPLLHHNVDKVNEVRSLFKKLNSL